jgi:sugar lactone lactonase YvrE
MKTNRSSPLLWLLVVSILAWCSSLHAQTGPTILIQPLSQWVAAGSNATLSVDADGTAPLNYDWYFNSAVIQSGSDSTLTVNNFTSNNVGRYKVIVTNAYGHASSQIATLAFPLVILTQPVILTNAVGSAASFGVTATGSGPFSYQWRLNGVNFPNSNIVTVAGNGLATFSGDGGVAIKASMNNPCGLSLDAFGNLYIADTTNDRIRKVDTRGIITTVAGRTGTGHLGDNGPATNAYLSSPFDVALDTNGNFYIADYGNNKIRKVDTNGIITTVAGTGSAFFGGDGGQAKNAELNHPAGVALDFAGNLFIADSSNNCIRKIDTKGIISTVAGKRTASFSGDGGLATNATLTKPNAVCIDTFGNLYIADYGNNRVRKVDTNGIITTVAGKGVAVFFGDGGAATNAGVNAPTGVGVDALGNLFIADPNDNRVRRVDTSGIIATVAGTGGYGYSGDGSAAIKAMLSSPYGLGLDAAGNLFVADLGNRRIREVFLSAGYSTFSLENIGSRNAGDYSVIVSCPYGSVTSVVATLTVPAPPAITVQPKSQSIAAGHDAVFSVTAAGSGTLGYGFYQGGTNLIQNNINGTFIVHNIGTNDAGDYTIVITNDYGSVTSAVATLQVGYPPTLLLQPLNQTAAIGTTVTFSVTPAGAGPFSYQWQCNGTDILSGIITTVAGKIGGPAFTGDGGPATNANLYYPQGVSFDTDGNMYIADDDNNRVRKVDADGIITTIAGTGAATNSGDGGPAASASLYWPNNVAFDAGGNMFIADILNERIRKIDTNGIITTVAGNGVFAFAGDGGPATNASFQDPINVVFDAAGNWYISDLHNYRIRRVDTNGIITTVAGNGGTGYTGDGGPATNASIHPQAVNIDASGNILIADTSNNRIRKVDTNGIITTIASSDEPWFVAPDARGNVYIADHGDNRILKVDTHGIVETVAGDGNAAYKGDGGLATKASLNGPACLAFDALGNLYIADWYNNRIREVNLTGSPTLTFSNLSLNNTASYSVIVSSPFGCVTSTVATLTLTMPPPQIVIWGPQFGFLTNHFGFNVTGLLGQTNVIEGSTNLVDWVPLFTNISAGTPVYFFDPTSTNFNWRFYRARTP